MRSSEEVGNVMKEPFQIKSNEFCNMEIGTLAETCERIVEWFYISIERPASLLGDLIL